MNNLEVTNGVLQALRDDGIDVAWQGLVTHWPGGHKVVVRHEPRPDPFVLLVSGINVWVCLRDGSTVARFDLNHPTSLEQLVYYIKYAVPQRLPAELPSTTQIALQVGTREYASIVADWESRK